MNCLLIQKMKSHPILFLSFTGRISSGGFVKASKRPGISGRETAMICMSKKLMSEPLWDDDTWCSSHPVRESKEKVMQHSQLALMDCTQVILEITEGEGPHSQGNGRKRKKSILSREETPPEHHNKREWCTQEKQIQQWDVITSKHLSRLIPLLGQNGGEVVITKCFWGWRNLQSASLLPKISKGWKERV